MRRTETNGDDAFLERSWSRWRPNCAAARNAPDVRRDPVAVGSAARAFPVGAPAGLACLRARGLAEFADGAQALAGGRGGAFAGMP